jgi:hypothetical protein
MKITDQISDINRRPHSRKLPPWAWLLILLSGIAAIAWFSPAEKSLGAEVRVVYLHGAWVWAALILFSAAGVTGLLGLLSQRNSLNRWSRALGRAGLTFWISYLPLSLWAMQTNWNGLFLAEPRWRLAIVFALGGLLLQLGVSLVANPAWASAANLAFSLCLGLALAGAENVIHPPSPIFDSEVLRIQFFFSALLLLTILAAWQLARWFHSLDQRYA